MDKSRRNTGFATLIELFSGFLVDLVLQVKTQFLAEIIFHPTPSEQSFKSEKEFFRHKQGLPSDLFLLTRHSSRTIILFVPQRCGRLDP